MIIANKNGFIKKHQNSIVALLLCIAALAIALLLHPIYETNDDPGMESLLYGINANSGTSYLVFINRILGIVLYGLVSVFPGINWYFIMHYSTCLVSLFVLTYIFISKYDKASLPVAIIVMAVTIETLFFVQFTKTAAIASISGGIGLIYSLKHKKSFLLTLTSMILLLLASMIRLNALLSICPFLLIVWGFELLDVRKNSNISLKKCCTVIIISIVSIVLSCVISNSINAKTSGNDAFNQYNYYRSNLQDYELTWEALANVDSEAFMVAYWMNNDSQVFTPEKLENLSNDYSSAQKTPNLNNVLVKYWDHIIDMMMNQFILIASLLVAVIVFIFGSKRKLYPIFLILCFLIVELYLVYSGRYNMHRVDFVILVSLFISMLYLCNVKTPKLMKEHKELSIIILVLFFISGIVLLSIPPLSLYNAKKSHYLTLQSSFKNACYDEDCFYLIHPLAFDVDSERNIYDLPCRILQNEYCYMGGWGSGISIPGQDNCDHSDTSIWEQCIDNENIKLVFPSNESSFYISIVEWYIENHFNSNVKGIIEYENEDISVYRIVSV